MPKERRVRIGITVYIDKPEESMFVNGIRQNVIVLRDLFEKCRNVSEAYIVNTATNVNVTPEHQTGWGPYAKWTISMQEAADKCDMIVMGPGSLTIDAHHELVRRGIVLTKQIMGSELSVFNETVLFRDNSAARNLNGRNTGTVKSVWISPHFFESDRYFFETQYDCEAVVGPYVWDPRFIQHYIDIAKLVDPNESGLYKPSGKIQKRISTMEPNINMVKTSTVPIIIGERLYRKYPETLEKLNVFCGDIIKQKTDMIKFVKDLDINRARKIFFEARYPIVWTLLKHTDIVLCHQNQCELNYLYLDAAWMGFPVVHNSIAMRDLGWYYPGNDAETAAQLLQHIAHNFDSENHQNSEYVRKSRGFAYRYMIDNPENIRAYEKLIDHAINS